MKHKRFLLPPDFPVRANLWVFIEEAAANKPEQFVHGIRRFLHMFRNTDDRFQEWELINLPVLEIGDWEIGDY